MCSGSTDCTSGNLCVAGRCQTEKADAGVPAIQFRTRRLVYAPAEAAYLRRGDGAARGSVPQIFTLGRASDGDSVLFLQFSVPLAREVQVVEAYVLLERTDAVDADPTPIMLHAARVVDGWDANSVSWGTQPRVEEVRTPATQVSPASGSLVRIDVREIVRRWVNRDPRDQGVAILAERSSPTGIAFAFAPQGASRDRLVPTPTAPQGIGGFVAAADRGGAEPGSSAEDQQIYPRLELYLK